MISTDRASVSDIRGRRILGLVAGQEYFDVSQLKRGIDIYMG
jgi:hypothetical protein